MSWHFLSLGPLALCVVVDEQEDLVGLLRVDVRLKVLVKVRDEGRQHQRRRETDLPERSYGAQQRRSEPLANLEVDHPIDQAIQQSLFLKKNTITSVVFVNAQTIPSHTHTHTHTLANELLVTGGRDREREREMVWFGLAITLFLIPHTLTHALRPSF